MHRRLQPHVLLCVIGPPPRRAALEVAGTFAPKPRQSCHTCSDVLPPSFFGLSMRGRPWCHSYISDFNRRQRQWRVRHAAALPPAPLPATKQCLRCDPLLPASASFWKYALHPSGLQSYCKDCTKASVRRTRDLALAVPVPEGALPPTKTCTRCTLHPPLHRSTCARSGRLHRRDAPHLTPQVWLVCS